MHRLLFFLFVYVIVSMGCRENQVVSEDNNSIALSSDTLSKSQKFNASQGEALLLSQYKSLEELKSVIQIKYLKDSSGVCLTYSCRGVKVTHELKTGFGQDDFSRASNGNFWDKVWLGIRCPFAVLNKKALKSIEYLGRRKYDVFGHGDVAFYDLAESMVEHISDEDRLTLSEKDLSEKGYLNTFNHIIPQAMMTSIYSEALADFVGDAHERSAMPELITGNFTSKEIADVEFGPVDNYLDLINNEWGQKLGKVLCEKYHINESTYWTPQLLANYLNDIQSYHSWVFQIAFKPFTPDEEIVVRFARKINLVI